MKVHQIVFSPTGGTQKVADILTAQWSDAGEQGRPINRIDLTDPGFSDTACGISKEDVALIAVPSYGGRVPGLAAERLGKIDGGQAQCVIVCVYGNRAYEDTLAELQDIAEQSNFRVIAAVAAVAEHSIMHQYAAGRPDRTDREELERFAERIDEKVKAAGTDGAPDLQIPGNRPYKKAGGVGLVPKAGSECNHCGLCAETCPAQAISRENPKVTDSRKCISCMRCVVRCPQSARKVNGAMVSVAALAIKKACSERKSNELYI